MYEVSSANHQLPHCGGKTYIRHFISINESLRNLRWKDIQHKS